MGEGVLVAEHAAWPRTHRAAVISWSVVVACAAIWLLIVGQLANPTPFRGHLGWGVGTLSFLAVGFFSILLAVVGALIVARRPRNAVGWVNVVGGLCLSIACLALIAGEQFLADPNAPTFVQLAAFVAAAGLQSSVAFFALVPLWFPNGPRSAGRFAPVAFLVPVAVAIRFLELFFQKGPDWLFPLYPSAAAPANPFEATGFLGDLWTLDHPVQIGYWLSGACIVLAGLAVGLQFRRSRGAERRQLAWFAGAVVLITPITIAFVYTLLALPPETADADVVVASFYLSLALPTIATLIAISRYRLYEIDRIVNRALVYAAVTALLAGLFAATITLSQKALLIGLAGGQSNDAALVLTTLIVTSAYTPLRAWVDRLVSRHVQFTDPRFGPYRHELIRTLETFDPNRAGVRLVREAVVQLHASGGAAFLNRNGELRLCATVGTWSPTDTVLVVPIGSGPTHTGELRLAARQGEEPYRASDVAALTSIADLAAQTSSPARPRWSTHEVSGSTPGVCCRLRRHARTARTARPGAGQTREDPHSGRDPDCDRRNDKERQQARIGAHRPAATSAMTRRLVSSNSASVIDPDVEIGAVRPAATLGTMPTFRAPRGTRDLLPNERARFSRIEAIAEHLAGRYGYRPMDTPLFEQAEVFERGVGEVTDIVEKELFRLQARTDEGEQWALRPEATAGIVRAYVQHGLKTWPQPVKVSLIGPMFRYDRPQAGRYRQFWQWDVEAIGDPGPAVDAELVELGLTFYRETGLSEVEVLLNSIGDPTCRPAYLSELVAYYRKRADELPAVERGRLEKNPLRLLDSKDPAMARLNALAPKLVERLCDPCATHFAAVRQHLEAIGVPYRIEPGLVRGLDYYTRTAFEFYRRGAEGKQQALGGGGRYDGLVELLGGKPTPGIGFALGLDRVILMLDEAGGAPPLETRPLAVVVGADPGATAERLRVATELRAAGLSIRAELSPRKLGRQLENAGREAAHFAVILGDELTNGQVQLRDLEAGTQRLVPVADLVKELKRADASHRHG